MIRLLSDKKLNNVKGIFSFKEKRNLMLISFFQVALNILDLVGVSIIGYIGAQSMNQISGIHNSNFFGKILLSNKIGVDPKIILGLFIFSALLILVIKSLIAMKITKNIISKLSNKSAIISSNLISSFLLNSRSTRTKDNISEKFFIINEGVDALLLGVIATLLVMISDISLLLFLVIGIVIVDPIMGLFTISFFGSIAFLLHRYQQNKSKLLGKRNADLSIQSNRELIETLSNTKDIKIHRKESFFISRSAHSRLMLSENHATLNFLPYVSKYIIEISLMAGSLVVAMIQFSHLDLEQAAGTTAVFLASGSRIAPAVLRIQQGIIQIRINWSKGETTLHLLDSINTQYIEFPKEFEYMLDYKDFKPQIEVSNLCFKFEDSDNYIFDSVSFNISEGEFVAILGPSGIGKSTLVDLMLGILEPTKGDVRLSNVRPSDAIQTWPGAVAYIPQDLYFINGTLRENITLGFGKGIFDDNYLHKLIEDLGMEDFIFSLPDGLDTLIGENGSGFSGGQKQLLGILRASLTNPRILFLDEATSALDFESEKIFIDWILLQRGKRTVVAITHRLSTVNRADKFIYLSGGGIQVSDEFNERAIKEMKQI